VFWVISVYFNIRNTLPKFCPFLLGHPVYAEINKHFVRFYIISTCVLHTSHPLPIWAILKETFRRGDTHITSPIHKIMLTAHIRLC